MKGKERKHNFQGIILAYTTVWKQIKAEGSAELSSLLFLLGIDRIIGQKKMN